jgi:hypothetical protein
MLCIATHLSTPLTFSVENLQTKESNMSIALTLVSSPTPPLSHSSHPSLALLRRRNSSPPHRSATPLSMSPTSVKIQPEGALCSGSSNSLIRSTRCSLRTLRSSPPPSAPCSHNGLNPSPPPPHLKPTPQPVEAMSLHWLCSSDGRVLTTNMSPGRATTLPSIGRRVSSPLG